MSDLPPGQWSPLLVGLYWPGADSVMSAINAARNRSSVQSFFDDFARQLFGVRTGPLAPMEGVTADAVRGLFEQGEKHATAISDKNGAKQKAFSDTADALNSLRSALSQIAAEGNSKIDEINQSKKNIVQKVAEIVQVIAEKQADAANKSTQFGGAITKAISDVLTAEGDPRSAQQFAADSGFDLSNAPAPQNKDLLRGLVEPLVKDTQPSGSTEAVVSGSKGTTPQSMVSAGDGDKTTQSIAQSVGSFNPADSEWVAPKVLPTDTSHIVGNPASAQSIPGITPAASAQVKLPSGTSLPGVPSTPGGVAIPGAGGGIPTGTLAGFSQLPTSGIGGGLPDVGQALAPQNLAQGFTQGVQAGAPVSAGAEQLSQAISQGAQNAMHTPVVQPTEFSTPTGTLSAATIPSSGGAMAVEQAYTPAPAAPLSATVFNPPAPMSVAPVAATPPPISSGGPLPAYGADLRAATPTVNTPPPIVPPPSTAPTSAPISSPNPTSGLAQPAVVSKAPASAGPMNAAPVGITESGSAATASGAMAGASAAQSSARARLRRYVEAVARQEPRLRWAVGDREDGTTILVTDMDSGWIPPGIEIPAGVKLLSPESRHTSFEKLLRDAVLIETWSPGQFLPNDESAEPVAMSLRARDLPTVDDLNWEITQATNWRDGLPRLAHTLTKAVVGGTGVLDTETDLLREHLRAISDEVYAAYPDSVDPQAVGSWQLLAAIDALVSGSRTALNYHFAWFRALHTAQQGR